MAEIDIVAADEVIVMAMVVEGISKVSEGGGFWA